MSSFLAPNLVNGAAYLAPPTPPVIVVEPPRTPAPVFTVTKKGRVRRSRV